jgi:hypothetical protein
VNALPDLYLQTWNATDETERARLLAEHWNPDATYTDPLVEAAGHEGIGATIAAVQSQFPGFVFSLVGTPDTHHRHTRFQWGLGPEQADPVVIGFDVLVSDEDGRIRQVTGFLDKVPA